MPTIRIPARTDRSGLDALGNPITNPPAKNGILHNGAESLLKQEDPSCIQTLAVSGSSIEAANSDAYQWDADNELFKQGTYEMASTGTAWELTDTAGPTVIDSVASTSPLPPFGGSSGGVVAGQYALVSDGNQHIATGVVPTSGNEFKVVMSFDLTQPSTYASSGASYQAGTPHTLTSLGWVYSSDNVYHGGWGESTTIGPVLRAFSTTRDEGFHTFEKVGSELRLDTSDIVSVESEINSNGREIHLFARRIDNGSPSVDEKMAGKITTFDYWSDATRTTKLVNMWAVPAGMTAQGASSAALENGMYDAVSDSYFYDATGLNGFTVEGLSASPPWTEITVNYPDFYVDGATGEYNEVSFQDYYDWITSQNGKDGQWGRLTSDGFIREFVLYCWLWWLSITESDYNKMIGWAGTESRLVTDNGETVTDNGKLVLD